MVDRRDLSYRSVFENFDERTMTAQVEVNNKAGVLIRKIVMVTYEVCDLCDGKGKHVNPAIDSNGLSREDFDEDPDFREAYFSGRYDIACSQCKGARVTVAIDEARNKPNVVEMVHDRQRDLADYAREEAREREMGC